MRNFQQELFHSLRIRAISNPDRDHDPRQGRLPGQTLNPSTTLLSPFPEPDEKEKVISLPQGFRLLEKAIPKDEILALRNGVDRVAAEDETGRPQAIFV